MKRLYLVRHAHRDVADRSLDNGLTEKGRQQAKAIADWLQKELRESSSSGLAAAAVSSPKQRCRETLEPFLRQTGMVFSVDPALSEQGERESAPEFAARVRDWLQKWIAGPVAVSVACSHGDWIPLAIGLLCGERLDLKKGGVAVLDFDPAASSLEAQGLRLVQAP